MIFKKQWILPVVVAVLVLLAGGCNLLPGDYDIKVSNNTGTAVDVYYRESGSTNWELLTAVAGGYTDYKSLPGGTYDFRAVWTDLSSASDPEDEGQIIGTVPDCVLDFQYDLETDGQTYDYYIGVSSSAVSFY